MNKLSVNSPSNYQLGYRAEIEGLRALAILLVVGNHIGLSWLNGGFIGVDVFFVLSGYLITGLLVQEVHKTGKIDLIDFYSRRLKRLLPALLFMILCVSSAATVLLAPFDQLVQASTARSASIWISNLTFAFTNLDYFASGADTNLFLHTWSLGVEEQFYLTWPLAILLFLGAFAWQGKQHDFTRLRRGLYATIGICLALSLFLSFTRQPWAFYLMPSRAWQFALGAIIFLWTTHNNTALAGDRTKQFSATYQWFNLTCGWLGFGLLIAAVILLKHKTTYPGAWALLPSLGTALILTASGNKRSLGFNRALSIKPMQWIGRLSYSWYLWHWPILVLGFAVAPAHELSRSFMLAALSLLLAFVSYWLVEHPIRRNLLFKPKPISILFVSFVFMGIAIAGTTIWHKAAKSWTHGPEMQRYIDIRADIPVIYGMGCDDWFYSAKVQVCAFGENNAKHTAVLLGDSIVGQWFPAVRTAFDRPGWRIFVLTKSSCPIVDEPWFYERIGTEYKICEQWRDAAINALVSIKPDIVLTGSSANYDFEQSQWISGTKRILDKLAPVSGNVVIISGTNELAFDGPSCLAQREWIPSILPFNKDCTTKIDQDRRSQVYTWLQQATEDYKNVSALDMNTIICPDNICSAEIDGAIVFRDKMHLTAQYSSSLSSALADKIEQIISEPQNTHQK